jgi:hypothetical protein
MNAHVVVDILSFEKVAAWVMYMLDADSAAAQQDVLAKRMNKKREGEATKRWKQ